MNIFKESHRSKELPAARASELSAPLVQNVCFPPGALLFLNPKLFCHMKHIKSNRRGLVGVLIGLALSPLTLAIVWTLLYLELSLIHRLCRIVVFGSP